LQIELPWMLSVGNELHWVRAREGQSGTMKQFRPMMVNLNDPWIRRATMYSLITDKSISDGASRGVVYRMAKRFVDSDRSHSRARAAVAVRI